MESVRMSDFLQKYLKSTSGLITMKVLGVLPSVADMNECWGGPSLSKYEQ